MEFLSLVFLIIIILVALWLARFVFAIVLWIIIGIGALIVLVFKAIFGGDR